MQVNPHVQNIASLFFNSAWMTVFGHRACEVSGVHVSWNNLYNPSKVLAHFHMQVTIFEDGTWQSVLLVGCHNQINYKWTSSSVLVHHYHRSKTFDPQALAQKLTLHQNTEQGKGPFFLHTTLLSFTNVKFECVFTHISSLTNSRLSLLTSGRFRGACQGESVRSTRSPLFHLLVCHCTCRKGG